LITGISVEAPINGQGLATGHEALQWQIHAVFLYFQLLAQTLALSPQLFTLRRKSQ
jgi:hypothetical protein